MHVVSLGEKNQRQTHLEQDLVIQVDIYVGVLREKPTQHHSKNDHQSCLMAETDIMFLEKRADQHIYQTHATHD